MLNRLFTLVAVAMLFTLNSMAQQRNKQVTIEVTSTAGDNLQDQPLTLTHIDYQVGYGTLRLNAQGRCTVKVYPGDHLLQLSRPGFEPLEETFSVADDSEPLTVKVTLTEKTLTPYALETEVNHDPFTGNNSVLFSWNNEKPAFFDDFESYSPFAIEFGQWTGIDADRENSAPIVGNYPNRGGLQYAQIISPLDVEPTWWYDMPSLRPYSGRQFLGFTRTNSGVANDDWLISPPIEVGTDNILSFMAKSGDIYKEKFMVYVTEKTDSPTQADFVRIDRATYETTQNYKSWDKFQYDLSAYAGKTIKFAIRYVSNASLTGAFMLMIDDVYVGSRQNSVQKARARRSPANPYETFEVYLDGQKAITTDTYSALLSDIAPGDHTLGVRSCYSSTQSPIVETRISIPSEGFAKVVINVSTNSILGPEAAQIELLSPQTSAVIPCNPDEGKVELLSLPLGQYQLSVGEGAFDAIVKNLNIEGDTIISLELTDRIVTPYNITADQDVYGNIFLRWNRDLGFQDSFEDYKDFASGAFGDWLSLDLDGCPVYPIQLGQSVIAFPGSGTATNPNPIAPMVFNPWQTSPAMLPSDPAVAAPSGDKTIIFFSPQRTQADKWLISPALQIREGFRMTMLAKGYSAQYPESMEICISTEASTDPEDFTAIATIPELTCEQWGQYSVDLSDYAGLEVRIAIHYVSRDAFFAQIDDFTVGPDEKEATSVDFGNIINFEIAIDGEKVAETTSAECTLPPLSGGDHTIAITAVYRSGRSQAGLYTLSVASVTEIEYPGGQTEFHDLQGRRTVTPKGFVISNNKIILK